MAEGLRTIRSLGPWMVPLTISGLVLMVALVAFAQWQALQAYGDVDLATKQQGELLEELAEVRNPGRAKLRMESATRSFLRTGREDFIRSFEAGRDEFAAATLELRRHWRRDPYNADALERIAAIEADWRLSHATVLIERRRNARSAMDQPMAVDADDIREGRALADALHAHAEHLEARLVAQIRGLSLDVTQRSEEARALAIRTALALFFAIAFMAAVTARGYRAAAERNAALSREINERQLAEANARASEARFAAFLNGLSEALVITDDHGRILWTNQRLPALFGHTPEELEGAAVSMLLAHPEQHPLEPQLTTLRAGGAERVKFEAAARSDTGREFPVEIAMSRFEAPPGPRIALVIRDVSERQAVDRMKSEFIASVSHELRTPLTAIMGSLALLREGDAGEVPAGMHEFLDMAHANSLRLARLVDDVIDIERIGSGALAFRDERFPLLEFLEESVQLNRGYADRYGVALRLELPVPMVQLRGDRGRLIQAITNLVSNACKFSPRGQVVSVAARMTGERIRLAVTDRGPGIPEAFRPRVFEKFAQADSSDSREKGGTGLGLAIARAIVVRLDGRIGFDTGTGRGTTFWIEMPAVGARS